MAGALTDTLLAEPAEPALSAPRPARRPSARRGAVVAATLGTWLAGALIFFWEQVTSGFDKLMGNDGDGRLIAYVHEHWYGVLRGRNAWLDPTYFYPTKGVLGYCDTFFLNEVFYAPLRALRVEPLLAYQLTLIALTLVGFCSFVALASRFLQAPLAVALLGAWVFTFANNLAIKAGHSQLYGVYWLPLILYLAAAARASRVDRPGRSAALAAASGLLAALLFFSAYYVAWFGTLAAGITAAVVVLWKPRRTWAAAKDGARTAWRSLLAFAGAFSIGIVPFLLTYLPVLDQTGGRRYADAMNYAGQVTDLWNVGPGNLLWRDVFDGRFGPPPGRLPNIEVNLAVPPLLVLATLALAVVSVVLYRRQADRASAPPPLAAVLTITAIVVAILPVNTSAGSAWAVVWNLPGAHAIRAIFRLQIVNQLVVALAFVAGATTVLRRWRGRRRSPLLAALVIVAAGLLMLEQVNVGDYSTIDRSANVALLDAVPTPPPSCRSFYVTMADAQDRPWYAQQIDAMLISQRLQLPAVNGYSGQFPPGWSLLDPQDPGYGTAVAAWVDQHGLRGSICGYDLTTNAWTPGAP